MKNKSFSVTLATCFGLGYFPFMPGTVGAFVGAGIYALTASNLITHTITLLLFVIVGLFVSDKAERIMRTTDPKPVIIDDLTGMLVAFYMIPNTPTCLIIAFILFRVFDIFKPFPIGRIEKMHGGKGIMLDDIVAGLYANIVVQILARLLLCRGA